jgi:hypothetical protein
MKKIPFDIKYRPEIESGKYKVVTSCGEPCQIVKWDCRGQYPLLVLIDDGDTDDAAFYAENGENIGSMINLYIVTDEPDYSVEFVQRVNNCITIFTNDGKFDHYKVDYSGIIDAVKFEQDKHDKALKFLQDAGIVDEDGELAEVYRSSDYETKEDKIYNKMKDVQFDNIRISSEASDFQNGTVYNEKRLASKVASWFISKVGIFGHQEFFTKELWRKVKGFKNEDRAEVMAAFLHRWWNYDYGFTTTPVGNGWYGEVEMDSFNKYIQHWMPVFKAYTEWQCKQR